MFKHVTLWEKQNTVIEYWGRHSPPLLARAVSGNLSNELKENYFLVYLLPHRLQGGRKNTVKGRNHTKRIGLWQNSTLRAPCLRAVLQRKLEA